MIASGREFRQPAAPRGAPVNASSQKPATPTPPHDDSCERDGKYGESRRLHIALHGLVIERGRAKDKPHLKSANFCACKLRLADLVKKADSLRLTHVRW